MTTETERLADAIDPRGKTPSTESKGATCYRLFEVDEHLLIAASDLIRTLSPTDAHRIDDAEALAVLLADQFGDPALFNQDRNMLRGHGPGECESCDAKRERYRIIAREILARHSPTRCADLTAEREAGIDRIMALTDEEVIAETIAAGEDPDEVVKRNRASLESAIIMSRALEAAGNDYASAQSNSEFQRSLMRGSFIAGAECQRGLSRLTALKPEPQGGE